MHGPSTVCSTGQRRLNLTEGAEQGRVQEKALQITETMRDQTSLRNLLAFLLVLHLASTNLVSAKSVCKCGNGEVDPPSKKVVDYNVRISEYGEQYNETIEVDTEKQTELFKVPAHRNVDQMNILHDFKMNMSLLLLPEKKVCYLLPLEKDQSTPKKLLNDLDQKEKSDKRISETRINEHKWTAGSEVTDRFVLSDELANFCAKYPIYYVEKVKDSMTTTRIQKDGGKNQKRRVGTNGLTGPEYLCSVVRRTCYTLVLCDSFQRCITEHIVNYIYCCDYSRCI